MLGTRRSIGLRAAVRALRGRVPYKSPSSSLSLSGTSASTKMASAAAASSSSASDWCLDFSLGFRGLSNFGLRVTFPSLISATLFPSLGVPEMGCGWGSVDEGDAGPVAAGGGVTGAVVGWCGRGGGGMGGGRRPYLHEVLQALLDALDLVLHSA